MKFNKTGWTRAVAGVLFAGLVGSCAAADLEVRDAWVRGTVAAQKATGAFMQLTSKGGVTVLGASSPAAKVVQIHEMSMDGDVMRMREVPRVDIKAGQTVELKPGGYHVMLLDLVKPLASGDTVPITLKVQGANGKIDRVEVQAQVRELAAPPMEHHHP